MSKSGPLTPRRTPKHLLLESGLWAMIRQRPYDIVPSTDVRPRDIFITAFDSAPLAPSLKLVLGDEQKYLGKAVEVLSTMTDGKVYLGCPKDGHDRRYRSRGQHISGPHPAGNAGVQIANVNPSTKARWCGLSTWLLQHALASSLRRQGRLLNCCSSNWQWVEKPCYVKATMGCTLRFAS